jgi:RNA polymerase sigma-70 factor (ECF subfamily)
MDDRKRQSLVVFASAGDQDALQQLIVQYHDALHGIMAGRIGQQWRRHVDPDDVLQDAYAAAFKKINDCRFDGPAAFYKWLETIALNELKQRQRALKSAKRDVARQVHAEAEPRTSYADLLGQLTAPEGTPSRLARRDEAAAALLSSLARLSDDQRDVIRLRFLEGKPVAEVAATLGKSEASIHALCRRGIRSLRESLVSITRFLTRL